jgi:hypothetical protein
MESGCLSPWRVWAVDWAGGRLGPPVCLLTVEHSEVTPPGEESPMGGVGPAL